MNHPVPATPPDKTAPKPASARKQAVKPGVGPAPASAKKHADGRDQRPAALARKAAKAQAPQAKASKKAVSAPAAAAKPSRAKEKLVRDSFTMPHADFALIQQLKDRSMGFKRETRKSELLRAGLQALAAMEDSGLKALLDQLPKVKTGRPRKTR